MRKEVAMIFTSERIFVRGLWLSLVRFGDCVLVVICCDCSWLWLFAACVSFVSATYSNDPEGQGCLVIQVKRLCALVLSVNKYTSISRIALMYVFQLFPCRLTLRVFSGWSATWLACCADCLIAWLLVAWCKRRVWIVKWVNLLISSSIYGLTVWLVARKWLLTSFDLVFWARDWTLLPLWLKAIWIIPTIISLTSGRGL
jgi:hypothetical protein